MRRPTGRAAIPLLPARLIAPVLALAVAALLLGIAPPPGQRAAPLIPLGPRGSLSPGSAIVPSSAASWAVHAALPGSGVRGSYTVGGFEGVNSTGAGCACAQPNVALAVGRFETLELVDARAAVYSTFGAPVLNVSLDHFAGAGSDLLAEAQARYDPGSTRFFAVVHDLTNNTLLLGVSTTQNASRAWRWHPLAAPPAGLVLAGPSLGVSSATAGISATLVNSSSGARVESELWVVNKSSLVSGGAPTLARFGPAASYPPGLQAVDSLGSSPGQYFVVENTTSSVLTRWAALGVPPSPVSLVWSNTSLATRSAPVPLAQNGTPDLLRAPLPGVASAIWQNGTLTLVGTASSSGVDEIELAQVNTSTGAVRQDLLLGASGALAFPAVSADARGDLTIVADTSSSAVYPSLVVAGQPYNEPNVTNGFSVLVGGLAPATSSCNATKVCAWGNTSAAAADPTDPVETWVAGEYAGGGGANWSTFIGAAHNPPLTIGLLTSDLPAVDVGQSVNFTLFATGGTGGYAYAWGSGLPPGCTVQDRPTIECWPTLQGSYNVTANVRDVGGQIATSSVYVFPVSPALTVARPLANRSSADVGQSASFRAGIAGGAPAYGYLWTSPVGGRCSGTNGPVLNCTLLQSGVDRVTLSVTDQNLAQVANASPFIVYPDPELTNISASPASLESGNPVQFAARVISFGSGSPRYAWTGLPPGCTSANAPNLTCAPASAGTFDVRLTMTDSNAVVYSTNVTLTVIAPPYSHPPTINLGLIVGAVVVSLAVVGIVVAIVVRRRRVAAGRG